MEFEIKEHYTCYSSITPKLIIIGKTYIGVVYYNMDNDYNGMWYWIEKNSGRCSLPEYKTAQEAAHALAHECFIQNL